jgi:hypothetical protein
MQIDESEVQLWNAPASIHQSFEPDSNVTVERDPHCLKQLWQSCSTEEGTQIDESDEQLRNAESSIRKSLQPGSNRTVEIV